MYCTLYCTLYCIQYLNLYCTLYCTQYCTSCCTKKSKWFASSLRNIILPTSSKMYWTLFKLYLTLYCVLYCTVYCTKTSECLAEEVYSLRNSFLPDCMWYRTLYCLMYWTLHCKLLRILFCLENQVQCTVKYVLNLQFSLLYIIQYNVHEIRSQFW